MTRGEICPKCGGDMWPGQWLCTPCQQDATPEEKGFSDDDVLDPFETKMDEES